MIRWIDKFYKIPRNDFETGIQQYFAPEKIAEFLKIIRILAQTQFESQIGPQDTAMQRLEKIPAGKDYQSAIYEMKQTFQILEKNLEKNQDLKNVFRFNLIN